MYEELLKKNTETKLQRAKSLPWKLSSKQVTLRNLEVFMNLSRIMKNPSHPLRHKLEWDQLAGFEAREVTFSN